VRAITLEEFCHGKSLLSVQKRAVTSQQLRGYSMEVVPGGWEDRGWVALACSPEGFHLHGRTGS
jgi:hypothetical protein